MAFKRSRGKSRSRRGRRSGGRTKTKRRYFISRGGIRL